MSAHWIATDSQSNDPWTGGTVAIGNFTKACRFRFDNLTSNWTTVQVGYTASFGQMFYDAGSGGGPGGGASLSAFFTNDGAGFFEQLNDPVNTPTANVWYHQAFSWDGTTAKLYTNGVLVSSNAPGALTRTGSVAAFYAATSMVGSLQDVVFYNAALSDGEIQQLYANRLPARRTNLVMHLPMLNAAGVGNNYCGSPLAPASLSLSGTPTDGDMSAAIPWGTRQATVAYRQSTAAGGAMTGAQLETAKSNASANMLGADALTGLGAAGGNALGGQLESAAAGGGANARGAQLESGVLVAVAALVSAQLETGTLSAATASAAAQLETALAAASAVATAADALKAAAIAGANLLGSGQLTGTMGSGTASLTGGLLETAGAVATAQLLAGIVQTGIMFTSGLVTMSASIVETAKANATSGMLGAQLSAATFNAVASMKGAQLESGIMVVPGGGGGSGGAASMAALHRRPVHMTARRGARR